MKPWEQVGTWVLVEGTGTAQSPFPHHLAWGYFHSADANCSSREPVLPNFWQRKVCGPRQELLLKASPWQWPERELGRNLKLLRLVKRSQKDNAVLGPAGTEDSFVGKVGCKAGSKMYLLLIFALLWNCGFHYILLYTNWFVQTAANAFHKKTRKGEERDTAPASIDKMFSSQLSCKPRSLALLGFVQIQSCCKPK